MIRFTQGNLLEAKTEALVNTVNTVGVMGKGIALMFKERFVENYRLYAAACKAGEVVTGKVHVTAVNELEGPQWIVNFPTKRHWRSPSQMAWVTEGLHDLRRFLIENHVKSVAVPALGAGNGGLKWPEVREQIIHVLSDLNVDIWVYEPSSQYLNVAKRSGVKTLTPARALIAELVRRYWVLGMECSLLEIQKLAWFLERAIEKLPDTENPLNLKFVAHRYGPYANRLQHLLHDLDGSYLHCEKRIKDAELGDVIWFEEKRKPTLHTYLDTEAKAYSQALERTIELIDGFESPFGMELLATVDWLLSHEGVCPTVPAVRDALTHWEGGAGSAARKSKLFDDQALDIALKRLTASTALG
ncbi:macro domain-containing protein [Pseudomonas kermanshahensis]|uniref:type II toxin-antitoxin system antitoxin DNA ADP-ribosyl glycohydrolase DarG n=1 Tax=Pseudomonas kermanshahensis TaxID=2745482 RepID=UPI0023D9E7FD|nr:macro domain-containing protein [Pseudomonas kermanshahensis]WEL56108.1 macro domain-containing protein [Pseudomonas kermanshahensis]